MKTLFVAVACLVALACLSCSTAHTRWANTLDPLVGKLTYDEALQRWGAPHVE